MKSSLLIIRPAYLNFNSEFKTQYFKYQRDLHQALSGNFNKDFYYQPQSLSQRGFIQREHQKQLDKWGYSIYKDQQLSSQNEISVDENTREIDDSVKNIERRGERSLVLVDEKNAIPTTTVNPKESLDQAALRAGYEKFGRDIDLWLVSKLPIGVNRVGNIDTYTFMSYILNGKPNSPANYLTKEETSENYFVDLIPYK
ncbi:hypothetical protein E3Q22_01779 [Wallemia mellicola]|uniref:Large ribosomal subunit protein mL46 N-terminal domain-containing protein n=1 Tax=Wallemia mellicola TaxID=1708541 RepID=A0A4T0NWT5_9BASI|nr:hypothetical protein E3Q22_01779 [Wallemia mellicola]TIC02026.1 hypothetical protein E3Q17_01621 [Wallemia mellicola]